eukprot:TRINITY_DN5432_c0_g1_i23.p6 TRINITY_DN5432_c0_g1~~TRINITY_DN5432_c0_g1_i23.p6  ORF type:complete len:113 (-),score=18.23 TRINITY_DN5432_c0_g1_i23:170-508(-)
MSPFPKVIKYGKYERSLCYLQSFQSHKVYLKKFKLQYYSHKCGMLSNVKNKLRKQISQSQKCIKMRIIKDKKIKKNIFKKIKIFKKKKIISQQKLKYKKQQKITNNLSLIHI